MRITKISIVNMAGLTAFEATLPAVAVISGKHGAGKSSFQDVLKYALGRRVLATNTRGVEHDPEMLHTKAEKGEAIISFDDGPLESLRVVIKPDGTDRQIKVRGKKAWQAAGSMIDDITNALAYDPMQFQDLAPKERLEAFLRVVPIEITAEEITAAAGMPVVIDGKPGLHTINAIADGIFRSRTIENQAADTQAKYAAELEAALPPAVDGGDWNAEVKRLQADLADLNNSEQQKILAVGRDLAAAKEHSAKLRRENEAAIDDRISLQAQELNRQMAELHRAISILEQKHLTEKADQAAAEAEANEASRNIANADATAIQEANQPRKTELATQIATAEERARATAQAEGTRKAAERARVEAEEHRLNSRRMTDSLTNLNTLKATVASRMNIQGVTIAAPRDGMPVDICREENGALVPFSAWNSADQDTFALRMAVLYKGQCGLVCIDNMGNWSQGRRDAVIARCKELAAESGMQFLLGSANDAGELKVVAA